MFSLNQLSSIPEEFRYDAMDALVKPRRRNRRLNRNSVLWIVQGFLALVFLSAGAMKLVTPMEELTKDVDLPGLFVRFLGVAEVLGAVGLIVPRLVKVRPGLTPLAASGLVVIMIGATVLTAANDGVASALFPLFVGLLAAFVVEGRTRPASALRSSYAKSRQYSPETGWLDASRAMFGTPAAQ
jgi:uncharacterized membrane protein YphA (DoxX/SURF4 family)